mgnify:CR=1 FL=1
MGEDAIKIWEGGQAMTTECSINLKNKTKSELILFIKELQDMLKEKNAEIEEYKRIIAAGIINAAKDELVQEKNKEIEKKDKQINLIINAVYKRFKAELLLEYGFENEEQFKQYFERKSKEC